MRRQPDLGSKILWGGGGGKGFHGGVGWVIFCLKISSVNFAYLVLNLSKKNSWGSGAGGLAEGGGVPPAPQPRVPRSGIHSKFVPKVPNSSMHRQWEEQKINYILDCSVSVNIYKLSAVRLRIGMCRSKVDLGGARAPHLGRGMHTLSPGVPQTPMQNAAHTFTPPLVFGGIVLHCN